MKKFLKNIIRFVLLGSFSMLMAACYGVYVRFNKRIIAKNTEGNSIANLLVRVNDGSGNGLIERRTEADGTLDLDSPVSLAGMQTTITDTDGSDNGGTYKETSIVLDDSMDQSVTLDRAE